MFSINPILSKKGFTLFELLIAVGIFALAACGTIGVIISAATLSDAAGYMSQISNALRQEFESVILTTNFDNLANYSNSVPNQSSLACYVQRHNSVFCPDQDNVKEVRVVMCYREKSNRIAGEDRNFNGILDAGEDVNGDLRLSSPCEIVTFVARKRA